MCQIFTICVRTIANFQRYEHKCQMKKIIFYSTFLSPLNSLFDFFFLFLESVSLPTRVLPLLTIGREQEEGGGGGGQERRKGNCNFVEIGGDNGGVEFAKWSGEVGE